MGRLLRLSSDLRIYFDQCSDGLPKKNPAGQKAPWSSTTKGMPKKTPPPPPFLVPAVIEALRDSEKYGHLTKLKPGEADVFCARDVCVNGGIIITSDSDLLVHDLGPAGSVIFFDDIEIDKDAEALAALSFRPLTICKSLKIKAADGLSRLAHELSLDHHITLEQAVENTKSEPGEFFVEFTTQYTSAEVVSHTVTEDDINLDPRISEIALQCLVRSAAETSQNIDLVMHLPFLFDSPLRTSAWEASKPTRQLAYGILLSRKDGQDPTPCVSEYRRLQVKSSGMQIDIPQSSAALDQEATSLIDTLTKTRDIVGDKPALWIILSIYQDILSTLDQDKTRPLSLELLLQDARGILYQHSWDFMHFLAQAQATYYSLRMVQQVIQFKRRQKGHLSSTISKLGVHLLGLPNLQHFPAPRDFLSLFQSAREEDGLSVLTKLCSDSSEILGQIERIQNPQPDTTKRKGGRGNRGTKRKSTAHGGDNRDRPASRNPFSVLEADE